VGQLLEEPRAPYWRIVLAPTTDLRIEGLHEALLLGMFVAGNRLPQSVHMFLKGGGAGGDMRGEAVQTAATILAGRGFPSGLWLDREAEDITSWLLWSHGQSMGEAGRARFQREAHRVQPRGDLVLATLDHHVIRMEDHEIVGVDHDIGGLKSTASTAGEPLVDMGFQAV
jgi:hypothetical protein